MEIKNKVIILTGVSKIGKDVAYELASRGAKLAVSFRGNQPALEIKDVLYVRADLSKQKDGDNLATQVVSTFGRIDGLVHMAATYNRTLFDELEARELEASFKDIALSAFIATTSVGREMQKNQGEIKGKIITFGDWSVQTRPYKDYLAYNVAKTAVYGLTKSLAKELAPNITVNCIAPGPIIQPAGLSAQENEEVLKNTPLGKWGGALEIARAVVFLLESDFVTGQILYVDGGRSIA